MATIKSYTDLEQSKKLAEFLPLESADMCYYEYTSHIDGTPKVGYKESITDGIPCWSLAALLGVLPSGKSLIHGENTHKYKLINCLVDAEWHDNPIDACVAEIEKLNELNLL